MAPIIYKPDPGPECLREILARVFTLRGWGRRSARLRRDSPVATTSLVRRAEPCKVSLILFPVLANDV